jgi:uncharacterized protein with beta-barrel porin domain
MPARRRVLQRGQLDPGADALIIGLGASYAVGASSLISMRYDGSFWSGYNSQELSARWTTKF